MPQHEDLGRGVYCIDADYLRPRLAAIYLVVDNGEAAFIETGTSHSLANALAALAELKLDPGQVRYVIPTHVHLDHAGGASAMMEAFPHAELVIHPRGARHMIDPSALVAASEAVYGKAAFARLYGQIQPVEEQRIRVADDGTRLELGRRQLEFFDTPGHARHHFCIRDATAGGIFTGDTGGFCYDQHKHLEGALLPSTVPTQFEPEALKASFARILGYEPERLFLTHYGEFRDPATQADSFDAWVDRFVDLCRELGPRDSAGERALEHRLGECVRNRLDVDGDNFDGILGGDMRLNAQGLAHWWRREQRD
ncbi:MAG: MBL fold metallo-hydrolase [Gammaproteobacteria bacterium]|nr:MBL fold metallo-hydrolase [Gammaproteobacteria bacterium]